jgi:hypothetical protein
MSWPSQELQLHAETAVNDLFDMLTETGTIDNFYQQFVGLTTDDFHVNAQPIFDEIACYCAFCITVHATQYLRKRRLFGLLRGDPDMIAVGRFADYVFGNLTLAVCSRPSRASYTFYQRHEEPQHTVADDPFMHLAAIPPDLQSFEVEFVDRRFKVAVFAARLAHLVNESLRGSPRYMLASGDLLPFGRGLAEITADLTRLAFVAN